MYLNGDTLFGVVDFKVILYSLIAYAVNRENNFVVPVVVSCFAVSDFQVRLFHEFRNIELITLSVFKQNRAVADRDKDIIADSRSGVISGNFNRVG